MEQERPLARSQGSSGTKAVLLCRASPKNKTKNLHLIEYSSVYYHSIGLDGTRKTLGAFTGIVWDERSALWDERTPPLLRHSTNKTDEPAPHRDFERLAFPPDRLFLSITIQ